MQLSRLTTDDAALRSTPSSSKTGAAPTFHRWIGFVSQLEAGVVCDPSNGIQDPHGGHKKLLAAAGGCVYEHQKIKMRDS